MAQGKKQAIHLTLPFKPIGGEKLLHFIWQFQYFNRSNLRTSDNEILQIVFPGTPNANQGPDFTDAQIRVDGTLLAGSVELHLKASQWNEHGHDADPNYRNVILHVVFENDLTHSEIPVLELHSRVSHLLLERYSEMMYSGEFIACAASVSKVKEVIWASWKERLLAERLTRKSALVFKFLEENNGHWEESFWWMLARNFGVKVNAEAFEVMARSIPVNMLARHKHQIHQLESLLFGQAGLLNNDFNEGYPKLLQREYRFLQKKYQLKPSKLPVHFLRMRPGNFPTIRLSQLAALIQNSAHLFSKIIETDNLEQLMRIFEVTANDYWHYHYRFDEVSTFKKKSLGHSMIENLMINTVVPVVFAFGLYHKDELFTERAIHWLEQLHAESNTVTRGFDALGLVSQSAFDSQAFLELKTNYCSQKKCLQCAVANSLLKST